MTDRLRIKREGRSWVLRRGDSYLGAWGAWERAMTHALSVAEIKARRRIDNELAQAAHALDRMEARAWQSGT